MMASLKAFGRLFIRRNSVLKLFGADICSTKMSWIRQKYTQHTGVKGLRNKKSFIERNSKADDEDEEEMKRDDLDLEDREYDMLANTAMHVTKNNQIEQNVFIIQPYIKWGQKKNPTSPDLQLEEAIALIRSLPQWTVEESVKVPLESLEKKGLFGSGKLEELKNQVHKFKSSGRRVSCIFISKGTLSFAQKQILETEFGLPVMDRYSIVIQILRLHATSAEAKLQVAMAEIPYIWSQMKDTNTSTSRRQGYALNDSQREMLRSRENKLKHELESIRSHRKLLRKKRMQKDFPTVAVVGYTNAGKTSLIKALTDEQTMQPRDQLFATLDVTAHAGILPCNLEVIYMDTVGFMSDIPTGLIECFVATLEDAMMADIIVHVQDVSHQNYSEQKRHVEETLKSLVYSTRQEDETFQPGKVINVGNKVDLLADEAAIESLGDLSLVSSKTLAGINSLMLEIESKILEATDRIKMIFSVESGGEEMSWLYKNSAVVKIIGDPKNMQNSLVSVVITNSKLQQFRHNFLKRK